MDRTSIALGAATRDALKQYKKQQGLKNYDTAIRELLSQNSGVEPGTLKSDDGDSGAEELRERLEELSDELDRLSS